MNKCSLLFFVILVVAWNNIGQTSVPKPLPTPRNDGDVVKISTDLIQLDVTVTDGNGKVLTDLKLGEVEIFENGKKQQITNFSFVSSGRFAVDGRTASAKNAEKIPVPQPQPVAPQPRSVRRTIAIVIDDLSMSWESVRYTREALEKFVAEQMQDGDLVSILRTGGSVGALQRFTTDKQILLAAIEKIKYNPLGTGGISALAPIEPTGTETLNLGMGGLPGDGDAQTEAFLAAAESHRTALIVSGSLGALRYVVCGMKEMPGRKSVMLFSDGFPLFERDKDGTPFTGLTLLEVRKLIEEANRAAVIFYPIDPRGLQVFALQASDNTRGKSPRSILAAIDTRRDAMRASQDGINFIAKETGGFAYLNSNDLNKGVARVLDDQSYYLVDYVPDSDSFDAVGRKYNKLEVKVLRKGAEVRYRSGFFGVTDTQKIAAPKPTNALGFIGQLRDALRSPFAVNGITLRLNSLFGSTGENDLYVRSLLHIDAADLTFTDDKAGGKKAEFNVLATSYGDTGMLVDQIGKTYSMTVTPDVYKKILAEGFVYHFKFPVKKAGGFQYRVAVRDAQSGKIGAASQFVTVPDLTSDRLGISSIILENMTVDEFQRPGSLDPAVVQTDPMTDTAVRRIKVGRVFRYSCEFYNAGTDASKQLSLQTKVRVFREGKLIMDGSPKPFELLGQTDLLHLRFYGGLAIGGQMEPGDYILQVIAIDRHAPDKPRVATQFVQFEVVE